MFWFFFSLRVDRIQKMKVVTGNVREGHFLLKPGGAFSKPSFVYTLYIMKKATEPASFMYDIHNNFPHRLASHAFGRRSGTQQGKNGFNTLKTVEISTEMFEISTEMFGISINMLEISTQMLEIQAQIFEISTEMKDIPTKIVNISIEIIGILSKILEILIKMSKIFAEMLEISIKMFDISTEMFEISTEIFQSSS